MSDLPPFNHNFLEVIPSALFISVLPAFIKVPTHRNLLKWHIPHPHILHWKEQGCHRQEHMAQPGQTWVAHLPRSAPTALSPWLPWLVTWLFSCPYYCNPSDGHLLCSGGRASPWEKYSAALHLQIRSITPLLLNCSWRVGYCVWTISNFQFIVAKDFGLMKVPMTPLSLYMLHSMLGSISHPISCWISSKLQVKIKPYHKR